MEEDITPIDINNDLIHQSALMYHHIKDNKIQVEEFIVWINKLLSKDE
jgi:hypothetical protein